MIYTNEKIKNLQLDYKSKLYELCAEYFENVVEIFFNDNFIIKFDTLYIDPITKIKYEFSSEDVEIEFDTIKNIKNTLPHSYSFVSHLDESERYVEDYIIGRLIEFKEGN